MQTFSTPDARLCSAVPYLTRGGRVADIGTDHAYLPIYLVASGICSAALACDINQGPILSARSNIEAAGLSHRISTMQTDGLCGVESFCPNDILIFGMGGELIVRILSAASWIKSADIGLVLQPMSRASVLRRWLTENGFAITGETVTFEDKYYQTIAARYCGKACAYSEAELLVGRHNIETRPPLFEGFLRHEIGVLEAIIKGKSKSKFADTAVDEAMKKALEELL